MKTTFILKDLSEVFYEKLNTFSDLEKFNYLNSSHCRDLGITSKVGNGSFRDKVELNQLLRNPKRINFKIEARRGYKLGVFEIM